MEKLNQPLFSFQVITDTHLTHDQEHDYNRHFEQALIDIASFASDSVAIVHVGDLTDHGLEAEYEQFQRIWSKHQHLLPALYMTMGNHDVGVIEHSSPEKYEELQQIWTDAQSKLATKDGLLEAATNIAMENWDVRSARFLANSGNQALYHDHWIAEHHFILLGTEAGLERYCTLSQAQLDWLQQRLGEQAHSNQPIFVFLHQPLKNTVAGSLEHQDWYGVTEDEQLQEILQQYPQVILFTGHTHWELGAPYTYNNAKPAMLNCASVAYLWTDADEYKYGSQGYHVEVYSDKVMINGRNFVNRSWITEASFTL